MAEFDVNDYDPSELDVPHMKAIDVSNLTKTFNGRKALDSVSFFVETGSICAFLGENGAGKTTTVKSLLGQLEPDSGTIRVLGFDPLKNAQALKSRIGFVPEAPTLYDYMTVLEIGRFASAFYPKGYLEEYARIVQEFGLSPNVKVKNLSKGMKAEVSLALAVANDPELLILDEPTSGLDSLVRRSILSNMADVAAKGKTVFLSSHQLNEVDRIADKVIFLKEGKIVLCEDLDELKSSSQTILATVRDLDMNADALKPLFQSLFGDCVNVERFADRVRVVGRNLSQNYESRLRVALEDKLLDTQTARPGLEDIFIAYMRRN